MFCLAHVPNATRTLKLILRLFSVYGLVIYYTALPSVAPVRLSVRPVLEIGKPQKLLI